MNFQLQPDRASNFAWSHDALFYTISGLTVIFTLLVYAMVFLFVQKYKRGIHANRKNPVHHNTILESAFIGIPTLLGLAIFVWSSKVFIDMRTPPKDAQEIFVIGKQWMWHIQHPNGIRENNEVHLKVGQPYKFTMISQDVIHGFYMPEMRMQYQVVPGRYNQCWCTPIKPGVYHLFCTIHCGTQHSEMAGNVYVMAPDEYDRWERYDGNRFKETPKTLAEAGKRIFEELNCGSCHGQQDSVRGPSLVGIYGKEREFTNGSKAVCDDGYIRESIINPFARITKGYQNTMPIYVYKQQVNEEQIRGLIEYIKSLGTQAAPASPETGAMNLKQEKPL